MPKNTANTTETPVFDELVAAHEAEETLPEEFCPHNRIYQDEPRDGGGAYYRCSEPNCHRVISDPDEWEAEHNKAWDWWR